MLFETPVPESPLKKPKLDEIRDQSPVNDHSSDDNVRDHSPENEDSSDSNSDIDMRERWFYDTDFIDDEHLKQEYIRYQKQLQESDGFDLDFVLKGVPMFGLRLPADLNDESIFNDVKTCTDHAIFEYNRLMKDKSQLKLVKVVRAIYGKEGCTHFNITLEAIDTITNITDTYQTQVYYMYHLRTPQLFFFRRKGQKEAIVFPADPDDLEDYERIKKCAAFAISQYNLEHKGASELVLLKIVNAGFEGTSMFRDYELTLEAKDLVSDKIDHFETSVFYNYVEGQIAMTFFELKASSSKDEE